MTLPSDENSIVARERLRLLAWAYYFHGGFHALMMSFFLVPFLFIILAISTIPQSQWNKSSATPAPGAYSFATPTPPPRSTSEPPPKFMIAIFAAVFGGIVLTHVAIAVLAISAGRCIQRRRHKMLIYVAAIINCLLIPYGTMLGVFTFIVLGSPEGAAEFNPPAAN